MRSFHACLSLVLVAACGLGASPVRGDEPVTVKVGDPAIDGSFIRPFKATYKITQHTAAGKTADWGTATYEVELVQVGGKTALRRTQVTATPKRTNTSIATAEHKTFTPLSAEERDEVRGESHFEFAGDRLKLRQIEPAAAGAPAKPAKEVDIQFDRPVFDFNLGAYDLFFAAFPLREGYAVKFPGYVLDVNATHWDSFKVTGKETVPAGAGKTVEAWVVETQVTPEWRETLWLSKQQPYVLKWVFHGPKGGHEWFELASFEAK